MADPCKTIAEQCATNTVFREACTYDHVWKHMCIEMGFNRPDRLTGFHALANNSPTKWNEHFKRWCGLRLNDKTLRKALVDLTESESDTLGLYVHPKYGHVSTWDTGRVTNALSLFASSAFSTFNGDISLWDMSNVTKMDSMFYRVVGFNQDISGWDVSKVESMTTMFDGATSFQCDISKWDVLSLKTVRQMFVRHRGYSHDLSDWVLKSPDLAKELFKVSAFDL